MQHRIKNLKLYKRLNFSIDESSYILTHFNQTAVPDVISFFCLCMLDRLKSASKALRQLAVSYMSEPELEYSAGIIVRAVMLDYIIVLNAFAKSEGSTDDNQLMDKVRRFCTGAMNDSVKYTLNGMKSKKTKLSVDVYHRMLNNLVQTTPFAFETYQYGTEPVFVPCDKFSTTDLIKSLKNSPLVKKFSEISDIYDCYSKYDHFGSIYYRLTRQDERRKLVSLNRAIRFFPSHLECTISLLLIANPNHKFLNAIYQNLHLRRRHIDRGLNTDANG